MNSLARFILDNHLDETKAMNFLQGEGLISDLCVWSKDVAEVDCPRAIEALKKEFGVLI